MTYQQFSSICGKYNINISEEKYNKFNKYYKFLIEENNKYNLTAITEEDDVYIKHFLDSMIGSIYMKDNSRVLDIGCGAGFPSIPCKIINPSLKFTLLDAVLKKVNFINMLSCDILGLDNCEAIHSRCEDLAKKPEYRAYYDTVVARAVAPLNVLVEYCIPFLKIGGKCILYKSRIVDDEIINATNAINKLKCKIVNRIDYRIDEIDSDRTILILEKISDTPNIYPRLQNKVRKNPL
ncbi:MAG: 16S rRNA (guanine(527)-N(7))-methyltransferase RsmG [Clostridiales bacterium]|nr:16S rRNA (guanine(527)-N(7))-methyltransferase RsmG [Clostridiales bacterium]